MEDDAIDSQEITQMSSRYEMSTEGRLLLEDNFNSLNTSLWKRELKMPLEPVRILSPFFIIELLKIQ